MIDRTDRSERISTEKKPPPKINNMPQTSAVQAIRAVWRDMQTAQQRILEETTLAELVRRSQENSPCRTDLIQDKKNEPQSHREHRDRRHREYIRE